MAKNKFKTGAKPSPRHVLASAHPYRAVGAAPAQWIWLPRKLSMWHNADQGICVTAEECFNKACSGIFISDATEEAWAQAHGVTDGAMLNDVLDWMAQKGFSQDGNLYNDGQKSAVDWTNAALLQSAIYAGPVKIGVAAAQLQNVVTDESGWFGLNFKTDQELDHCVSLCGYGSLSWLAQQIAAWYGVTVNVPSGVDGGKAGYGLFTWNTVGILDVASMLAITGEAWSRTPNTIIQGNSPPTPDQVFTPTPGPTPVPVPPGPAPVPTPTPQPGVIAVVDRAFAVVIAQFARVPGIANLLRQVNKFIDAYLRAAGYQAMTEMGGGTIPPAVITIIDAAFTAAEAAYPQAALIIELAKKLVDQYLPLV